MENEKSVSEKIKYIISSKRMLFIIAVITAVAAVLFIRSRGVAPAGSDRPLTMGVRTTVLKKSTMTESVTVSGTVESTETVNVTSTVSNATISEIPVQAGDRVEAGDVIAKLYTADIVEKIEKTKEKLADSVALAQQKYDRAVADMNEAYAAYTAAEEEYNTAVYWQNSCGTRFDSAKAAVSMQQTAYNNSSAQLTDAITEKNNATARYNTALSDLQSVQAVVVEAESNFEKAQAEYNSLTADSRTAADTITAAQQAVDSAATILETAKINLDTAQQTADEKSAALQSATEKYNAAYSVVNADENTTGSKASLEKAKREADYNSIEAEYNNAVKLRDAARTASDSKEKNYNSAVTACESAKDSLENAASSDELEQLYEEYNDCIITAAISGTVTQINAQVGDITGGNNSVIAVIENTDNLKISTSFREYDVQNIQLGMKCIITSDANDRQLSGYVSQISPVASTGGMGSSDVTFGGEITIDGTDHGLLIGMNAKAEVILDSTDNVYMVPYDAVGTNEAGEKVIYVQQGEDFRPVVVTTGMETDYYIEISSEQLTEGMIVRSSADADRSESMVFTEDGEEAERTGGMAFGMGGFPGGMPSGDTPQGNRPDRGNMGAAPGGRG